MQKEKALRAKCLQMTKMIVLRLRSVLRLKSRRWSCKKELTKLEGPGLLGLRSRELRVQSPECLMGPDLFVATEPLQGGPLSLVRER